MLANYLLNQKAIFRIVKTSASSDDLLELLQGLVFDYIRTDFSFEADWNRFCSGTTVESTDQLKRLQTAVFSEKDKSTEWALMLRVRDSMLRRRNWMIQIGIRMTDPAHADLYFAQSYYDHLAGSFVQLDPPYICSPSLFDMLHANARIQSMIGSFPLPADAILLEEELLDDFQKDVYDPERQLPVLLITCPDLLDPTEAAQLLFGNAMIFWSDDPILFERIREILLPVTDSRWDSIQVLLPTQIQNAYHPLLSATDVTRMGRQQTMVSLWQAYCSNFRAEDRRSFVTVDAIVEKRERRQAIALQESLNQTLKDLGDARGETKALNTKLESLQSAYDKLAQSSNQDDIAVLEGMITEISAEHDRLKQEIAALSTRLYACMGVGFSPSVEAEACMCELEHAIFVCFARLGGKGN